MKNLKIALTFFTLILPLCTSFTSSTQFNENEELLSIKKSAQEFTP